MRDFKLNKQLAEICGIHAGDGYLRNDGQRRELTIEGSFEEKEYYDNHVVPLFSKFFNVNITCKYHYLRGTYGFSIRDLKVVEFMHSLGFPYGKKSLIVKTPKFVFKRDKFIVSFLMGYFDTDGCLAFFNKPCKGYSYFKRTRHYYPSILLSTISGNLSYELINKLFVKLDLNSCYYTYKSKYVNEHLRHQIVFYGYNNLYMWLKFIGMSNPVQYSKYLVWKKYGFCPPRTTYPQRLKMIDNSLNPEEFYK